MTQHLHILNGDSIVNAFNQAGIEGTICIFREILSEGPSHTALGDPSSNKLRIAFLSKYYAADKKKYIDDFVNQLKIIHEKAWDEITLWFEYDLFCQINSIFLLNYLVIQKNIQSKISIIYAGAFSHSDSLLGLGEISPDLYPLLFNDRKLIPDASHGSIQDFCNLWISDNHEGLKALAEQFPIDVFPYLSQAIDYHLARIPKENEIHLIEKKILVLIHLNKYSKKALIKALLDWDPYYGLGDLTFKIYVDLLSPLYKIENEILSLNNSGKETLKTNKLTIARSETYCYGSCQF